MKNLKWEIMLGTPLLVIIIGFVAAVLLPALRNCSYVKLISSESVISVKGMTHIGKNQHGYNEYKHNQTGMIFIHIPAGTFRMGSHEYDDERPIHEVTLNSFLISKYETTQEVWQKIMGNNPSAFKEGDDYPVEMVSYDECQEFCKKTGLRLPTEAEWEYAARAGTTTRYYWGNNYWSNKKSVDYMWYSKNSDNTTHPVGEKKPNDFGLHDMSGNVWEFCQGWFGKYESNAQTNPLGPASGKYRVLRGGSWFRYAAFSCRVTSRFRGNNPDVRDSTEGFRCAFLVK